MKHIKKRRILLIIIAIVLSPFILYKLEGTKIHWIKFENKKVADDVFDVFVLQNPPSSKEELIKLIEEMNDTIDLKSRANKTLYVQSFYKETFNLTRFYKPYYHAFIGGALIDIRSDNSEFINEYLVSYVYNDKELIKEYKNCKEACPTLPYYRFETYNRSSTETINDTIYNITEGSLVYFYPNGFKENPNKHWKIQ
ncbi:hypothetical protein [Flavobacterium sp. 5]|uniref:hypothetical protein n=1 Tax=Flavobacterium sp. 5 TaxID=2035199 RepID=UPI000C2BA7B5|nr:hypothetical protein [Flavobacterium sp. 5]PKB18715.1 hypothetical protein CLU82_4008 [Flavobacterium sp. 5]